MVKTMIELDKLELEIKHTKNHLEMIELLLENLKQELGQNDIKWIWNSFYYIYFYNDYKLYFI